MAPGPAPSPLRGQAGVQGVLGTRCWSGLRPVQRAELLRAFSLLGVIRGVGGVWAVPGGWGSGCQVRKQRGHTWVQGGGRLAAR